MIRSAFLASLLFVGLLALSGVAQPTMEEDKAADEKTVQNAGFAVDAPALLDFFRKRSPTDDDRKHIAALIQQLGDDDFEKRELASQELRLRGTPVLPQLKVAIKSEDKEIRRRATVCIEEIETPGPGLPIAAAHLLVRHKPAEAVDVLLAYLPNADDDNVEEEILNCLLALTPGKGKVHATIAAAVRDPVPAKRGAAGYVLGQKGTAEQAQAVRDLLADKQVKVRYRAAQGLLAGRDKAAVPALLQLLEDAPPETAWRIEDVLTTLAGEKGPSISLGDGAAADRKKCRDEWSKWWKENGDKVDLAVLDDRERLAGLTLGIEYNTGRVFEVGLDKKVRWEIKGLKGPMEAQVLPNSRVLICESNGQLVTERDFLGNVKWEKNVGGSPTGCQRLPNGNTFVSTYNTVMEFDREGKQVYNFALPGGSNAIRKHRNGNIIYATEANIVEVTTENKPVRTIALPAAGRWVGLQDLPGDRFLLGDTNKGRVLEVDKAGTIVWEAQVNGACGVCRLPNGHTVIGTNQRVVELDRAAKIVWELTTEGYVRRVHRR